MIIQYLVVSSENIHKINMQSEHDTFRKIRVYTYKYRYITINTNTCYKFKRERRGVYGRFQRKEREEGNDLIIL